MEFSYRISETDYLNAERPLKISKSSIVKTIMFWLIILACLMVLITWLQHSPQRAPVVQPPTVHRVEPSRNAWDYIEGFGPLLLAVGLWALTSVLGPKLLRRRYKKDPAMQGQFTVTLTPESISIQNTAGISTRSGWDSYFGWYEAKGVMVLFSRPATRFLVSLAGLSDAQQNELRGILTAALPKK